MLEVEFVIDRLAPASAARPFRARFLKFMPRCSAQPARFRFHITSLVLSAGHGGERVGPSVDEAPVVTVPTQQRGEVNDEDDVAIGVVDGLFAIGKSVVAFDGAHVGELEGSRGAAQHACEVLGVHRRVGQKD